MSIYLILKVYLEGKESILPTRTRTSRDMMRNAVTRLVIVSSFMNAVGEVPYSIVYILNISSVQVSNLDLVYTITSYLIYLAMDLEIFVYYRLNRNYRNVLNGVLKKLFVCD